MAELKVWADRSLFYLAKIFTEQIKPGDSYRVFKKCVSISILNFKLFQRETDFYSCFHFSEGTRHFIYTDKLEFHVIELPKLPEELRENSSNIELWAKFINAESEEEFDMLAKKDPYIKSAYRKLKIISQNKDKRQEYEAREKALRDYNEGLLEAEERGEKRGAEIINRLNEALIQDGRIEDLKRSIADKTFQRQLMSDYGITSEADSGH